MRKKLLWPVLLIVVLALSRWPKLMPTGFSAVYAILFCAGLYIPGRLGWIVPLCVMVLSDLALNMFYYFPGHFLLGEFLRDNAPIFLAYAGLIALGRAFGPKRPWWMLLGGGLLGAIIFYIVTNTAAWLSLSGYQKTLAGWIQAITIGLPGFPQTWEFFRNTMLSGGLFTGLFVAAMKLTEEKETSEDEEPAAEAEPAAEPAKEKA